MDCGAGPRIDSGVDGRKRNQHTRTPELLNPWVPITWVAEREGFANGEGVTVHGFRSTFRMWAAETTNYPREFAEHALAHQLPDAVERAYQRGSQFAKRAALMAEWAVYCGTVPTDAVVKPIRGAG